MMVDIAKHDDWRSAKMRGDHAAMISSTFAKQEAARVTGIIVRLNDKCSDAMGRGRLARIDGVHVDMYSAKYLCVVLRERDKDVDDGVLNSEPWTRSYRPMGEFDILEEDE